MRSTFSDIWRTILNCEISQSAGLSIGRLTANINIAHEDLKRTNLFTPAPYLRTHLHQLPLLRLRTQATGFLPTHLHLNHSYARIPYDERLCPFCLPQKIVGGELHTITSCPHTSHISTPLIQSIRLALNRFDLWAWSTYTGPQKLAMMLGSTPPLLQKQHVKA